MSAGITRIHGTAATPSQRPSTLSFYTITFPSADVTSEINVVNGVFDQIFSRALQTVASIGMIGTPRYAASNTTIPFAIEDTGVDSVSPSYLGTGPDNAGQGDAGATTALAFQEAIRALQADLAAAGSGSGVNNIDVSSVTVAAGIRGTAW